MRRFAVVAAITAACLAAAGCQTAPPNWPAPQRTTSSPRLPLPAPPAPDLNGYPEVMADNYRVDNQNLAFRTPSGLICRIGAEIGCDGPIHGTMAPANEVVLHGTASAAAPDGFHHTSRPRFVAPPGSAAKLLPLRHKIVVKDLQCAVDAGALTLCTRGFPLTNWFVLTPNRSAIGPRVGGLPPRFPDPHDFVVDDQFASLHFTVAPGLACKIGGVFGCNGPLPGISGGDNEIYVDLFARQAGLRTTDKPRFTTPGPVKQLAAWHRIDDTDDGFITCLAGGEGGVACYAQAPERARGFVVSAHSAWTFGD